MTLTTAQIDLIRDSFNRLEPTAEVSEKFYDRLFALAPELRSMFRPDMTGQGMRFMSTLGVIVNHLGDPETLTPYLQRLAQGHAAFGVKAEHFYPMGQALIATMREALGSDFPDAAASAWEAAYDHLATEMIRLSG